MSVAIKEVYHEKLQATNDNRFARARGGVAARSGDELGQEDRVVRERAGG